MKLFQYWNDRSPPAEVATWIDGFRDGNPDFEHELWSEESAARFIANHYGERELSAFTAVRVPAMQADYVRLCLIDVFGGLYCDVDHQLKKPLSGLVERNPGELMLDWGHVINTAFLLFPKPGNPYIRACLDLCTENVCHRRFDVEFTSTGPGVQNAIAALIDPSLLDRVHDAFNNSVTQSWRFADLVDIARARIGEPSAALREAYGAITIRNSFYIREWMDSDAPAYKETDQHWLNWSGPIYK